MGVGEPWDAKKIALEVILPFLTGGLLVTGASVVANVLGDAFLAAIVSGIPIEIITLAFVASKGEIKPYLLAAMVVLLVLALCYAFLYGVQSAPAVAALPTAANRATLVLLGLLLWVALGVGVYFAFRNFKAFNAPTAAAAAAAAPPPPPGPRGSSSRAGASPPR